MELKVEDNSVLERWSKKNESTIELEFRHNAGPSTMFFHDTHSCKVKDCYDCQEIQKTYRIFAANLEKLQVGDTFEIQAALINNGRSELPAEIHNFKNYQPLWVACTEREIRLPDTPEGIKKKYERDQQRLQQEREDKEKFKAGEKQVKKDRKRKERKETFQQIFGKRPYITQIIISVIGGLIAGIILNTFLHPIPRTLTYLYGLKKGDRVITQNTTDDRGKRGVGIRRVPGIRHDNHKGWVLDGATGKIIDGPKYANDHVWWKILWDPGLDTSKVLFENNNSDRTGWTVETVNGVKILKEENSVILQRE